MADNPLMITDGWRERLTTAIKKNGLSLREVSLAAGAGPGYISSILTDGKEPTIQKLMEVCQAVPVSLIHVLYGFDVTLEDEAIIAAMHESPEKRDAVVTLLGRRMLPHPQPSSEDPASPEPSSLPKRPETHS